MMLPPCSSPLLKAERLTQAHCDELAPNLRPMDRAEVEAHGYTARDALWYAQMDNHSHALMAARGCVGAFGFTDMGTIWSLFAPLNNAEAFTLTKNTPAWVKWMLGQSGKMTLLNSVAVANVQAIKWLKASRCFDIDEAYEFHHGGLTWHPFQTKPLSELP